MYLHKKGNKYITIFQIFHEVCFITYNKFKLLLLLILLYMDYPDDICRPMHKIIETSRAVHAQ